MLNWANLSFFLVLLAGPICGLAAARAHAAGAMVVVLFALGGMFLGLGLGIVSRKVAVGALGSRRLPTFLGLLIYLVVPCLALVAVMVAPFLMASVIW